MLNSRLAMGDTRPNRSNTQLSRPCLRKQLNNISQHLNNRKLRSGKKTYLHGRQHNTLKSNLVNHILEATSTMDSIVLSKQPAVGTIKHKI
jgi:hypothetical protein